MSTSIATHSPRTSENERKAPRKIPTPKVRTPKFPPLNQCVVCDSAVPIGVFIVLPLGASSRLCAVSCNLTRHVRNGLYLIASLLWSSKKRKKDGRYVMCLVKNAARRFVDRIGSCANAATFVAKALGCEQATQGNNALGKVANTWFVPTWCDGREENVPVQLTPSQLDRWNRRGEILRECFDVANPHAALVRMTLARTKPGPAFHEKSEQLKAVGEQRAARNYLKKPEAVNLTRDGDVQSNVSRLPEALRGALQIDGQPVAEFDVKSAHGVLLGMFYRGESGEAWAAEHARFAKEVLCGFPSIYGEGRTQKRKFLAALNQRTIVARNASKGYREFERMFPLLAAKVAAMKKRNTIEVGRRLRCAMAKIQEQLLIENHADGIPSIPVVDSAVVAMPDDFAAQHRSAFRTAWRLAVPIAKQTGTAPLIKGSNGEKYRFFL